jgi:aspartyl protease family protein
VFGSQLKIAVVFSVVALFAAQKLAHVNGSSLPTAIARSGDSELALRPQAAQLPLPGSAGQTEYRIAADRLGQYFADVEIDGRRIHMLVDTGASSVALSHEDAASVGILPLPADYKYPVNTANGIAHVAHVRLRNVRLGGLLVQDVDAAVAERGALHSSLLGMTFLSKLSHIEVASGALVLRQ